MDLMYIKNLTARQKVVGKKLYAVISLLLVASLLLTSTSFAWLTLALAPEVTDIQAAVGSNGNLEIALNVNGIGAEYFNTYEEPSIGIEGAYEKNPYWGNVIDLSDERYGLNALRLKPASFSYKDNGNVDISSPFIFANYGIDGRITKLSSTGAVTSFDKTTSKYVVSSKYGVRMASGEEITAAGQDYIDQFAFCVDLLFRTNALDANLLLQTEGIDRIYPAGTAPEEWQYMDNYEAAQGQGSQIIMDNPKLLAALRVAFIDTITGEVYATAKADEEGFLHLDNEDGSAIIRPLVKNGILPLTMWVYLDGEAVGNLHAAVGADTEMKVNIQFATDALLTPAYSDNNKPIEVGAVSNLHFKMTDGYMTLAYDYPEGITGPIDHALYNVSLTDATIGETFTYQNTTNSLPLTTYTQILPGTYNKFRIDSKYNYEIVASADFDNLELVVSERDSTAERLYVRIDPTSELSNYGYTYTLSGLTPNTPFLLYTASEKSAFGTGNGPRYFSVTVGISDANGNITANLSTWESLMQLKDNPSEQGAELTKLYFKIVEHSNAYISEDRFSASFTQNLRYDWTHYVPGGVGTNANQNGVLGDNISWSYTTDGTLRISGSGAMEEHEASEYPWSGLSGIVTKVIIEDGITTVSYSAFREFIRLQSVSFGNAITEIGAYAFYHCCDLQSFTLPYGLTTIGDCAFRECETLTSVTIPDSVTEIGSSAFSSCSSLEEVTLSSQLTEISFAAFGWCGSLKSIVIPEGVTCIEGQAFNADPTLESITLPITLNSIQSHAFDGCGSLTDVYYNGSKSMWKNIDISKISNVALSNATIHYALEDEYAVADDGNAYFVSEAGNGEYTIFALADDGSRDYELATTATLNESSNTLTISSVNNYPNDGVVVPAVVTAEDGTAYSVALSAESSPFYSLNTTGASVTLLSAEDQFVGLSGNSTSKLFRTNESTAFTSLDVSALDTSKVTDMSWTFEKCDSLVSLNVSNWDTSNVTDMNNMFRACLALTELDVSNFNTAKVTDMSYMFSNLGVTELDVSSLDTSNVVNMWGMFAECFSLTKLDVSGFDTRKVTDMSYMFSSCWVLTELNVSKLDTSNVTNMAGMFIGCLCLTELDVSRFNTSAVTDMSYMFSECCGLTELNLSNFDTSEVTNMMGMFVCCCGLTELDVSGFDTAKVTNMQSMFASCSGLTELDVSRFDTSTVTNMDSMFTSCSSLTELDLSGFDTTNVTNMFFMFHNCSALTTLDVSGFDTADVTDVGGMFQNCSSLQYVDISGWDLSNAGDTTIFMFYNCPAGQAWGY